MPSAHIPAASHSAVAARATPAAERRVAVLHGVCVDTGRRHAGSMRGGILPHTPRRKKYCPDRIARRCSPIRCSPGSCTAGSSPPALAPHAPTTLDSAGLHGAKCRCGGSPPQASHRWRPGGFDRFPGLLCLGVLSSLSANAPARRGHRNQGRNTALQSFCRQERQTTCGLRS